MAYAIKGGELKDRFQRCHVILGDSNNTYATANRLPQGRIKDARRGPYGFLGVPLSSGADLATMGFITVNGPSPATITSVNFGTAPPAPLADLTNRVGVTSPVGVYTGSPVFSPAWRTYFRNSAFAVDPFTNQSVKFGEIRVNCGTDGSTFMAICTGCAGTTTEIYNSGGSPAIDDSVGTRGGYTFYETPTCATGNGSADISMYRQTFNGTPGSGKAVFPAFRTIRHATLDKTRYGEIAIADGGLGMDNFVSETGPAGDTTRWIRDAYLDAVLSAAPIEGDYDSGGKSGVVMIVLTQNRYTTKAAWKADAISVYNRVRSSLTRIGKGSKDILICFELTWDTTLNIEDYNPATEQVRFNEMWDAMNEICATRNSLHDKAAALPTGLEIRERYGELRNWAHTGLALLAAETGTPVNKTAAVHPSAAGFLAIPLISGDIIMRGDGGRKSLVSSACGVGVGLMV